MAKMGFEENRRIVKEVRCTTVKAIMNGVKYRFRSKFEYHWAQYLEILRKSKQIIKWEYETERYYFFNEKTAPVQYNPDFKLTMPDGSILLQETKGHHDGSTNRKLQRMSKHYPEVKIELVLQNIPKRSVKGANRRQVAERYCERVYDGTLILRQLKGQIKDMPALTEQW